MQINAENTGQFVGLINIIGNAFTNCGANHSYFIDGMQRCMGAYCDPYCTQLGLDCTAAAMCNPGCYCQPGYARSKERCIDVRECTEPIEVVQDNLPRFGQFGPQK